MACFINAENNFEIRITDDSKGKGLFSTKDFKEGDVLFEEEPLVSCQFLWNQTYGYMACDYCMRPLETPEENARRLTRNFELVLSYTDIYETVTPVECQFCGILYCSNLCKEKAWNEHHCILCLRSVTPEPRHPLVALQESWKHIHYPPETASIMLLARIIARVRQSDDKEKTMSSFAQFCHRTVNEEESIAHKLLGDEFKVQLERLRQLLETALGGDDVQHWLTPEGFRSLFALVGTNGQGIGTSPLSVWVKKCEDLDMPESERDSLDKFIDILYDKLDEEAGSFLNAEGSGLFSLQSCCNHSCAPNAIATFPQNNFRLVMTAAADIKKGDEICISYLDECNIDRSRHSRQKILRENYLFSCHCTKCENEKGEPDETSEEEEDDCDDMIEES